MEAMLGSCRSLRSHPTLALPCTQGREPFVAMIQMPTLLERHLWKCP